jgi:hypothetical protein
MIHICILTMLSYGAISCYFPCWLPFAIFPYQFLPFLKSLLLTWNPSFCVVWSCKPWSQVACKLTSSSPFPPHSKFPSPQGIPSLNVRPTKTTSRSQLHIVRNNCDCGSASFQLRNCNCELKKSYLWYFLLFSVVCRNWNKIIQIFNR